MIQLQHAAGNRAVCQLLERGAAPAGGGPVRPRAEREATAGVEAVQRVAAPAAPAARAPSIVPVAGPPAIQAVWGTGSLMAAGAALGAVGAIGLKVVGSATLAAATAAATAAAVTTAPVWGAAIGAAGGLALGYGLAKARAAKPKVAAASSRKKPEVDPRVLQHRRLRDVLEGLRETVTQIADLDLDSNSKKKKQKWLTREVEELIKKLEAPAKQPLLPIDKSEALLDEVHAWFEGKSGDTLRALIHADAEASNFDDDSMARSAFGGGDRKDDKKDDKRDPAKKAAAAPSKPKSLAEREKIVLGDVEGEFRRWAKSGKTIFTHPAVTLGNGPFSTVEKEAIRTEINKRVQIWVQDYPHLASAKAPRGQPGKFPNFNIWAFGGPAGKTLILNLHFLW